MEFNSPPSHDEIIEDLMNGKFILSKNKHFDEVKKYTGYYEKFFKISFRHEFLCKEDFAYLVSKETNENLSRDISIFIAILCYELDKEGVNFHDRIEYGDFAYEEVDRYFENSSFTELIQTNNQIKDNEARRKLIKTMTFRNILEKHSEDRFSFSLAYKVFFDFAKELARNSNNETNDVDI